MEDLFQQIMDLGEEVTTPTASTSSSSGFTSALSGAISNAFSSNVARSTATDTSATTGKKVNDNEVSTLTSSTSNKNGAVSHADGGTRQGHAATTNEDAVAVQSRHDMQLQKQRYNELLADSFKLRSEYEAYQLRMNHVVRQYKQRALQAKHMLEELRLAGATGSLDEAFVAGMKRQIGDLQKQLNESIAASEKAYQQQREAEMALVATEKAKREELEALASQISHFSSTPETIEFATTATSQADASVVPKNSHADEKEGPGNGEANGRPAAPNAQQLEAQVQLALRQAEISELRAQLQQRDFAHHQQLEEQRQDLEMLRTEVELCKERESALKATQVAALKKADAEFADKEAALQHELEAVRAQVQKATAEQSSQRIAQELRETQEREQEERMQAKERELQSLRASLQSLQAAVEAKHVELREMEMTLHNMQTENRQLQAKVDQMSAELLHSQQQLASRENDMLDVEKERQRLRAMLRQEEEETLRVQKQLTQLQRIEAERGVGTAASTAAASIDPQLSARNNVPSDDADGEGETEQLSSVVATQRQTIQNLRHRIEVLENELTTREVALRRQQAQAQEISAERIEFMKIKEETNARIEQLKDKIRRLESELVTAQQNGASAASTLTTDDRGNIVDAELLTSAMERRQFLIEAKRSADRYRISRVRQMRAAFFFVLLLVVGMTLYATFSLAPAPAEKS